jgi:transcription elongation GreA/GreB family factor
MADRSSVAYLFRMSSAFVKEQDDNFVEELPDRPISKHPNDVTEAGLALIEQALEKARAEVAAAQEAGDRNELARAKRDMRYWMARQATAHVVRPPTDRSVVHFASTVTIVRDDGRRQTFRIVGEDEADPSKGSISHVAPLARSLLGKKVGDTVSAGQGSAEIVSIE